MAVRLVALVLALAGLGFEAVGLRGAHAQQELTTLVGAPDAARARALAATARRLNPDARVGQALALVELRAGDRAAALATLRQIVRDEPRNAEVWAALGQVARGYDDTLAATARSRATALSPPVPPPR